MSVGSNQAEPKVFILCPARNGQWQKYKYVYMVEFLLMSTFPAYSIIQEAHNM
jgi:hypothetical protein